MKDQYILNKIKIILLEHGVAENDIEKSNIDIDSIQFISILVSVEQEFNVVVDEEILLKMNELNAKFLYDLVKLNIEGGNHNEKETF